VVALCEAGDALTGGHCQIALEGVELVHSGPLDELDGMTGWWCFVDGEPVGEILVYTYAICIDG
jgi:hypothetical protein